ncbi:MAG: metallophosphoesterase [Thermoanaerobaculia bacterium]|nr:metallophosphoesterase [Thermoanaerobaculia bacterium]
MNGEIHMDAAAVGRPLAEPAKRGSSAGFPWVPVLVFLALWLGGSWAVVGAWIEPWIVGGWLTLAAIFALTALPVVSLVRGVQGQSYPSAFTRLFVLRPFWYAMLFLPVLAAATLLGGAIGLPFGSAGPAGRWALAGASALLVLGGLAGYLGSRRLVVRHLDVQMARLPPAFDGLRLVQISDLHVGPHTPRQFLTRVAQAVEDARPDLIAITGDQVDDFARDVEIFRHAFAHLQAPLGVFAVAGNHDVYAGWSAVRRGLESAGFQVLVNESVAVERRGQQLFVVGTGDPAGLSALAQRGRGASAESTAAPDVDRTLFRIPPSAPVLALAHNPMLWPSLARRGVDLTLSGHTHYGQLAIPKLGWSMASPFLRLAMGAHRDGDSMLYINPGTNYWGIPFRLGTPPEVTVLTLRCGTNGEVGIRQTRALPDQACDRTNGA